MIAPAGLFFLLSFAVPLVMVGRLSLFKTDYVKSAYIGVANFVRAVKDPYFVRSFANVFWFVLGIAPFSLLSAYWIASFLFFQFGPKAQAAGRFICYVPALTAGLVMTMLWMWFLLREGLFNQALTYIGLEAVPWLGQPWPARLSIVLVSLSGGNGGFVILFMATMHAIPSELHDAALIDGASERQYRQRIVRPFLMPMLLLGLLLIIVGTMQAFETIYVLTGEGGPKGSTATPAYNVFQTAFWFGQSGFAAAKGLILMVVVAAVVAGKQWLQRAAGQVE